MNNLKRKLRSRTGASITFALLLFLICAVLSSVILAAATSASGRMSQMAETDQRYYAVTSASELLKDMLHEQKVSIVILDEDGDGTKEEYIVEGKSGAEAASGGLSRRLIVGDNASPVTDSILTDAAYQYYNRNYKNPDSNQYNHSFTISSATEDIKDAVGVSVAESLDLTTGGITMTVSSGGTDAFRQRLTFAAQVDEIEKNGEPYIVSLTWKLFRIETLSTAPDAA